MDILKILPCMRGFGHGPQTARRSGTLHRASVGVINMDTDRRRADEQAAIPLKQSTRDPERVRRVLAQWLAPRLGVKGRLVVSPISLPGGTGVANETLLFDAAWSAGGQDHSQGFVARVTNHRPLYAETDLEIHARMYEALADVPDVPVPAVYGYESNPELLGGPFFVMERISGDVPADQPRWYDAGFVVEASPERRRAMWEDAVRVLAALHSVDASRFPFLAPAAGDSGLADHLAYWRRSLDEATAGAPHDTLERGHEWLRANLPVPTPTGISWGDARFANIMFRDDRVVAIFDWDTVSLSGAEADLAWWRNMDGPAAGLPGIGTPDELVERWQQHTGRTVENLEWHEVFTNFRLGVIMLRLFANMAAEGQMPADEAALRGRDSASAMALGEQLDAFG